MTIIRNKMPRVRVAAIIIENKKLLLIAHKKNKNVYWLLPGGGIDFGESLAGALTRELNEELGVSVNVNEFAWVSDSIDPAGKRHIVNICFYCSHIEGEYSLGRDKRLHDFGFFNSGGNSISELALIKIERKLSENLFM